MESAICNLPGRKIVKDRVPARVVDQVTKLTKEGRYKAVSGLNSTYETRKEEGKTILTRVFYQILQEE